MPGLSLSQAFAIANDHFNAGRLHEAEEYFGRILAVATDHPEALAKLAIVMHGLGRGTAAIELLKRATDLYPKDHHLHSNLGFLLANEGQLEQGTAHVLKALALDSRFPDAHQNLGSILFDEGRLEEAERCFRKAVELRPEMVDAWSNLANVLHHLNRFQEAFSVYQRIAQLAPNHLSAFNCGWMLLQQGDFQRGWELLERRPEMVELMRSQRFRQPLWDGSLLEGRRILLHAEQGLGDTFQFVRYVQWVAALGAKVILETQPPLKRLLRHSFPDVDGVFARGETLPPFDVHCPLMSLPRRHHTTLETIPARVPYLHAEPQLVEQWHTPIPRDKLNVGLVWAGNPRPKNRSIMLSALSPLAQAHNAVFYSLQKDIRACELGRPPAEMEINDLAPRLNDFADTAAAIANLDLVITVETSVAHLAGAMGKPVWVLLQAVPDWRWLLGRDDSPWYPTMRLFRQPRRDDWGTPIRQIACELALLAKS